MLAFYRLEGLNTARLDAQIITQGTKLTKSSLVGAEHLKILPRIENKWEATLLFTMLAVLLLLAFGKIIFPDGISFWKLLSSMSSGVGGALNGLLWVKIVINSICISTFAYFFLMTTWNEGSAILPIGVLAKNEVSYFSILWWTFLAHLFKFGYKHLYDCASF